MTGYNVYRRERSMSATRTLLTPVPVPSVDSTASFIDTGLANGRDYYYSVTSLDAEGAESDIAVEKVATPFATFDDSPHGPAGQLQQGCDNCHLSHDTAQPELQTQRCVDCHDGTKGQDVASRVESITVGSQHSVDSSVTTPGLKCDSCHRGHQRAAVANGMLLEVGGVTAGNDVCLSSCHGEGSTLPSGDLSVFLGSGHDAPSAGASKASVNCVNCHEQHGTSNSALLRYSPTMSCLQCHAAAGPGPSVERILSENADPKSRHALSPADQTLTGGRIGCGNCHNPHASGPAQPLVDPDDPSPVAYSGSATAFCLRCHDSALPTAAQTGSWAEAPLASGGATSTPVDIAGTWATDTHGSGSSTSGALHLRSSMGYAIGDAIDCQTCHDPHGTGNPFSLRDRVVSADGSISRDGILAEAILDGDGHAVGYDLRFFCASCHELTPANHVSADISAYPTDCTGCHKHGSGSF